MASRWRWEIIGMREEDAKDKERWKSMIPCGNSEKKQGKHKRERIVTVVFISDMLPLGKITRRDVDITLSTL